MRDAPAIRGVFALVLMLLLIGCGLQPVYTGGAQGQAAGLLGAVEVMPIADRAGFLVRDQLLLRMPPAESPRYRLQVVLDDDIIGFGVRGDNTIIRERRTLRARYRLIDIASNDVLLDTSVSADAGIDVVSSEYAVIAAEQSALERLAIEIANRIVSRLARYGRTVADGGA